MSKDTKETSLGQVKHLLQPLSLCPDLTICDYLQGNNGYFNSSNSTVIEEYRQALGGSPGKVFLYIRLSAVQVMFHGP